MVIHTVLIVLIVHTNISTYIIHPFVECFHQWQSIGRTFYVFFSGLQQKQEDLCFVNESPCHNEDDNNEQTFTNQGTYVCTYEL